jgi:hypothetical protein
MLSIETRRGLVVLGSALEELAIFIGKLPCDNGGRTHSNYTARIDLPGQHYGAGGYDGVFAACFDTALTQPINHVYITAGNPILRVRSAAQSVPAVATRISEASPCIVPASVARVVCMMAVMTIVSSRTRHNYACHVIVSRYLVPSTFLLRSLVWP